MAKSLKEKWKLSWNLFLYFVKIGCFTFGGGWSIVAQMQKEFVETRHWITDEDLLDITSVGRSLPGMMILNITYLFGHRMAGVPGALACVLGCGFSPFFILCVVTVFYVQIRDNVWIEKAMMGVRSAVAPIVISAAVRLGKSAFKDNIGYIFALTAFGLLCLTPIGNIPVVVLGGVMGYVVSEVKNRRGLS